MSLRLTLFAAVATMAVAASPAMASFSINFATATSDTSIASGDNTLTFSSPSDVAGTPAFTLDPSGALFSTLGTQVLDSNASFASELDIAFANAVQGVELSFATFNVGTNDTLTLTTNAGTTTTINAIQQGGGFLFPEGFAGINGPAFTSLTIVDTAGNSFALGSIDNVPEPMTLTVLGLGLAGLAAARRRA